jgi:hypothetical protein
MSFWDDPISSLSGGKKFGQIRDELQAPLHGGSISDAGQNAISVFDPVISDERILNSLNHSTGGGDIVDTHTMDRQSNFANNVGKLYAAYAAGNWLSGGDGATAADSAGGSAAGGGGVTALPSGGMTATGTSTGLSDASMVGTGTGTGVGTTAGGTATGGGAGTVNGIGVGDSAASNAAGTSSTGSGGTSLWQQISSSMSNMGGGSGGGGGGGSSTASPSNSGIGMAPTQDDSLSPTYAAAMNGQVGNGATSTDTPRVPMTALQAKIASMGTGQKILAGMGEFGAALNGRASPLNTQIANDQAARQNDLTHFNESMNVMDKMPPGEQRDQFVQSIAPTMGSMQSAFESVSKMPDGQRQLMMNYYPSSPTLQSAMAQDKSGNLAMKIFNSQDGLKIVQHEAEQSKVGLVSRKVATLAEQAQSISPDIAKEIASQGYTTPQQIQRLSDTASKMDTAHSQFALTPADQFILSGDKADIIYTKAGTMNSKGMDAIQVKKAEDASATTPFMKEAEALYGKGTKEYNDAVKAHISRMDTPAINTAVTLSGDALEQAAARYRIDGTLPTGLGRGGVNQAAILSRAADQAKNNGQDGESLRISQLANKASTQALGQVSKQENMVGAFEKTANANADLALAASDKVDRTGTPVINRWIQAGRQNITGDVDASKFNAYNNVFANEYAKVISGTMGNTPVSDQARSHALDVINTAQTKEQYAGVITALKADMANRMTGFAQQRQAITSGMKTPGTATPSIPTFATEADAKAANLTSGTKIIINGQSGTWH